MMKASTMAGPACSAAACPVMTKMPPPITAPMPSAVRPQGPSVRFRQGPSPDSTVEKSVFFASSCESMSACVPVRELAAAIPVEAIDHQADQRPDDEHFLGDDAQIHEQHGASDHGQWADDPHKRR